MIRHSNTTKSEDDTVVKICERGSRKKVAYGDWYTFMNVADMYKDNI